MDPRVASHDGQLRIIEIPPCPAEVQHGELLEGFECANATARAIALGAQEQMAVFFASGGLTTIHPSPPQFFEAPVAGPLPETLNYIR